MSCLWITGAGGLIGHALAAAAPAGRVMALTRPLLDLTDGAAVRARFAADAPALVLHCAGLTRSPACQADPELARRLNVEVTRRLAGLAAGIPFVFLSTDLVFDGLKGVYVETDPPNPRSVYAATKLEAEAHVLANPGHTVLRTSLVFGRSPTGDRAFNEDLRAALAAGRIPSLFTDEFRCPLAVAVLARAVWELVQGGATGLYHVAGSARLSRWEIGQQLVERHPEYRGRITPESLAQYRGAPRSPDTSLNCDRAQGRLSFRLPGMTEWLKEHPEAEF